MGRPRGDITVISKSVFNEHASLKGNNGFTLVEVLVVVIVIAILAALILIATGSAGESARREVCAANRETIRRAWNVYKVTNGTDISLDKFIDDDYEDAIDNNKSSCPSKGIYSAYTNTEGYQVVMCSVHSADVLVGEHFLPGTTFDVASGWPTSFSSAKTLAAGSVFYYTDASGNTKYYLLTADMTITASGYKSNPANIGNFTSYAKEVSNGSLVNWSTAPGNYISRGSLVEYNGSYYTNTGGSKYTTISSNAPVNSTGTLNSGWARITTAAF